MPDYEIVMYMPENQSEFLLIKEGFSSATVCENSSSFTMRMVFSGTLVQCETL